MANLIACAVCNQQISDSAQTCPHCGDPRTYSKSSAVTVKNVDMEFGTMIGFMVKAAIAAIPAAIILFIIGAVVMGMLGGMFGRH